MTLLMSSNCFKQLLGVQTVKKEINALFSFVTKHVCDRDSQTDGQTELIPH